MVLNTILPKEWQGTVKIPEGETEPDPVPVNEGQELVCVYIDVQGCFSARKFNDKVKQAYTRHELWRALPETLQ